MQMNLLHSMRSACSAIFDRIYAMKQWETDEPMQKIKRRLFEAAGKVSTSSEQANLYCTAKELLAEANFKIMQALAALDRCGVRAYLESTGTGINTTRVGGGIGYTRNAGSFTSRSISGVSRSSSVSGISPRGSGHVTPRGDSTSSNGRLELDISQMRAIKEANEMIKSAAADYSAARDIMPSIPFHNEALVISARAGLFLTVLAPGFLGNMGGASILHRAMVTAQEMADSVKLSLEWAQRKYTTVVYEVKTLQAEAAARRADVVGYQSKLVEGALAALPDEDPEDYGW